MDNPFFTVYRTASWDTSFPFWGRVHLSWLAAFLCSLLLLALFYRRLGETGRRRMILCLTGLLLADELLKHAFLLALGEEDVDYLPLHLCSVGLFICLWYAIHPNRYAGELLFAVCLPGAAIALLFPGWSVLPARSFLTIHSFTFHILLCLIPLLLHSGGELVPDPRRLWFCLAFLVLTAIPVWLLDRKWGTNFYFLTYPGVGNPGYQIGLPVCAGILWLIQYGLLAVIRALRNRRRGDKTE